MKTFILIISSLSLSMLTLAQDYAVINDKDGFVNVRKEPNTESPVIGKFYEDEVFAYDEGSAGKDGWIKVYRYNSAKPDACIYIEGFVHKSRIKSIANFKSIPNKKISANRALIQNDSISIAVLTSRFIPQKHKLGSQLDEPNQINFHKIDGRPFWGTDGRLPKIAISSLKINIAKRAVLIPRNAFSDLYEPSFRMFNVYLDGGNTIYIRMDNSDGAGAYTVIWVIKNGKYLKRFVDNSEA
jgi:hypothetical protein